MSLSVGTLTVILRDAKLLFVCNDTDPMCQLKL